MGRPAKIDFDSHSQDAKAENIEFLMKTCGFTIQQTADRLGITRDSVEKFMKRREVVERDTSVE